MEDFAVRLNVVSMKDSKELQDIGNKQSRMTPEHSKVEIVIYCELNCFLICMTRRMSFHLCI